MVYQRILTYTLRSFTTKISQMLFLTVGLMMTGHAVLTPMLMVILMITGDFLAMSATTDHVRPSQHPNVWRIGRVTAGYGILMHALPWSVIAAVIGCSAVFALILDLAKTWRPAAPRRGLR